MQLKIGQCWCIRIWFCCILYKTISVPYQSWNWHFLFFKFMSEIPRFNSFSMARNAIFIRDHAETADRAILEMSCSPISKWNSQYKAVTVLSSGFSHMRRTSENVEYVKRWFIKSDLITVSSVLIRRQYAQCVARKWLTPRSIRCHLYEYTWIQAIIPVVNETTTMNNYFFLVFIFFCAINIANLAALYLLYSF